MCPVTFGMSRFRQRQSESTLIHSPSLTEAPPECGLVADSVAGHVNRIGLLNFFGASGTEGLAESTESTANEESTSTEQRATSRYVNEGPTLGGATATGMLSTG